jgi:hypothetical protein
MVMKTTKRKLPTEAQSRILRRIAQNGGVIMLTLDDDLVPRYSDAAGGTIGTPTAKIFIRNNWVTPQRDSLFDLTPQTWRIKSLESQ